ncbi:hypothetical protein cyc_05431 [Cyclospora cayetanensis]|uniref:Uncharacterized protein n=1 Tax=Cyclospora cayetanensis TaxID=88456 RepID=A0A1D3CZ97_9EIME|nr:hypothetical protein cyc_05431 [Cyclospora cayetanensis]
MRALISLVLSESPQIARHIREKGSEEAPNCEGFVGEDARGNLYWLVTQQGDPAVFKLYREEAAYRRFEVLSEDLSSLEAIATRRRERKPVNYLEVEGEVESSASSSKPVNTAVTREERWRARLERKVSEMDAEQQQELLLQQQMTGEKEKQEKSERDEQGKDASEDQQQQLRGAAAAGAAENDAAAAAAIAQEGQRLRLHNYQQQVVLLQQQLDNVSRRMLLTQRQLAALQQQIHLSAADHSAQAAALQHELHEEQKQKQAIETLQQHVHPVLDRVQQTEPLPAGVAVSGKLKYMPSQQHLQRVEESAAAANQGAFQPLPNRGLQEQQQQPLLQRQHGEAQQCLSQHSAEFALQQEPRQQHLQQQQEPSDRQNSELQPPRVLPRLEQFQQRAQLHHEHQEQQTVGASEAAIRIAAKGGAA